MEEKLIVIDYQVNDRLEVELKEEEHEYEKNEMKMNEELRDIQMYFDDYEGRKNVVIAKKKKKNDDD